MQAEIGKNIISVKNKINAACKVIKKDPKEITLIAVSKKKDIQMIKAAKENDKNNFGEKDLDPIVFV